jgi:hypothetical protein
LENISAVRPITRAAGQITARAVARLEFDVIGTRGNWADADCERSIAVNVGRDYAQFNRRCCSSHPLPCDRCAGTASAVNRKLAEVAGNVVQKGTIPT